MLEDIKAEILRQNPEGFPLPNFSGERELGEEYSGAVVAVWNFPEFPGKAMCVPFSLTGCEIETARNRAGELAEIYAGYVIKSAVDAVHEMGE